MRLVNCFFMGITVLWPSLGAAAEIEIDPVGVRTCLRGEAAQQDPAHCVTAAHTACLSFPTPEATAAATLCFAEARDQWNAAIGAGMAAVSETLDETQLGTLQVNLRFDLMGDMLQCDRMQALAELSETPDEQIALQSSRCGAVASGLTFVRLALGAPAP